MKFIQFFVLLFCVNFLTAQEGFSKKWSDLFSYNNVIAMELADNKIITATENGVFYYDVISGEITKLSKANGLHEVKVSAFDYNATTKTAIIGYQSGNLDVITPESITYVVDIPLSQNYTGSKKINHISITDDKAVISTGYGVSIFNILNKEFGDTCFFFNGTNYISVNESVMKDNKIYAATSSGIYHHDINVTFPVFSQWQMVSLATSQIDAADRFLVSNVNTVRFGALNSLVTIPQTFTLIKDVKIMGNQILIADKNKLYLYDFNLTLIKSIDYTEEINTGIVFNNQIFTGTKFNGILNESNSSIKPDGPYSNVSYKLSLLDNQIWVSTGGRDSYNSSIVRDLGYYHFDGSKWNYPNYFINNPIGFNVLDAVPNPSNPTEVYFTNYTFSAGEKGIYKMVNNEFVKAYKQTDANQFSNRPVGLAFDENNNLFCSVGAISNALNTGFYVYNKSIDDFDLMPYVSLGNLQKPIIKDGIIYTPAPYFGGGGLFILDYKNTPLSISDDKYLVLKTANNMPVNGTVSVAIDKNDDAWIGTRQGLRVLASASSAVNNTTNTVEPIIITQNGIAEELFKDLSILQIEVDSGNQKWVSTEGGGVFYVNSNGEQTIHHFTKANSPLPTDNITDIKVDTKTGKVYFATLDGIVVYQGDVLNVTSDFGEVLVYPNPVITSQYRGNVKIRGLAEKTNIRITDAAGNLVHQAVARGGYYEWNLTNNRGIKVASGIYYVLMTNEDATDKATAKIAIVN